ncbi:MAG: hypothetical protein JWO19_2647 [Bryobacterales bacterium]|nr:hypothetical protein [Bryobacterales bacterium]
MSARPYSRRSGLVLFFAALVLLLIFGRSLFSLLIDYKWWGEMGQVETWRRMWLYRYVPDFLQWLILALVLWVAHLGGIRYAGAGLRRGGRYNLLVAGAILLVSLVLAAASIDGWVVARFIGGRGIESPWRDPVFGRSLVFYFFELPFYTQLTGFLEVCAAAGAVVYYVTARVWQVRLRFPELWASGQLNWDDMRRLGRLETGMFKVLLAFFLVGLAAYFWLGRYELLYTDHGELMTGVDYVQQHLGLPLQTAKALAAVLAAVLVLAGRRKLAMACALVLVADVVIPPAVNALQVRPNELALQRPFIERHIEATRAAYGLNRRAREAEFPARKEAPINFTRNASMLDNVRLWDWRAFHDTLSQSQPLRPYAYGETDVDRYQIDGQMRQVLLAPRELDLTQLGDAQNRWVIAHTIYTHGYGLALAEASRITPSGLPELLIRNAPVEVLTPSLKVTRPEIYYGEESRDPVFVRTTQPEFNYPSGSEEVHTRYEGHGGIPAGSMGVRLASALAFGDPNIVLSDAFTPESRMMIRRGIRERLTTLAPFITWDPDAYLVIGDDGRLVWIIDGYTLSEAHPYARPIRSTGEGEYNYIRNSVKATVDAYHGDVKLYLFDDQDPLILAYERLFPGLLTPAAEMPADLRRHTRFPELLFRVQAELYRTYHMRVPDSFYNRADLWDVATFTNGQAGNPQPVTPTYMVATLPGESQPEFLLTIPFTPHNKQNLIGLMAARCDGEHLGEIVFLQLPKQEIIPGPLQIEALINQNPVISKDLSLWNQQGSQVLRSQILVLPIDNTFLFVAPIYIQAAQARMPQLEKVVLAAGNQLVYADTYQEALAQLAALQRGTPPPPQQNVSRAAPSPVPTPEGTDTRIESIRGHLDRYRALSAQGKWAEAGKELEAVEALVKQ